jgi:hypothetical protein
MSTRLDRVTERGLRRLKTAIKESGGELSGAWIQRDPDQGSFTKDSDAEAWYWLVEGATRAREQGSKDAHTRDADTRDADKPKTARLDAPDRYGRKVSLPPRPWGSTRRRALAWGGFALAVILLTVAGVFDYGLGVVLVLAFAAFRAGWALWENVGPGDGG